MAPLAEREFRLLFLGRTVSFIGNAFATTALAFAVLDVTGSKADLGYVLAARSVPQVVFLLAGGVWADRLPRHHVMVGSNLASGASQAALAGLLLTGSAHFGELIALAAVNGTSSAFFFPASIGIIPQTVPAPILQSANALLRLGLNASWIGGAALGGIVVAASSPGWAIAADAGTFFVAAALVAAMHLPPGLRLQGSSFIAELGQGWREFRSRSWLWAIVLQFSFVNAATTGSRDVLGPAVAKAQLGGPASWGAVLAADAIGLVCGGLAMLRLRPRRILLTATFGIFLLPLTPLALAFPLSLPAVIGAAFLAGVGTEIFGVLWDTTVQQEIPGEKLSRVSSYDALGSFVLIPVGLSAVGAISALVGTRTTFFGAAALIVAATALVLLIRDVRTLERR
ncbi:MAG: MFS transporter [Actinobacteria bacterium]|nr:MAG: MFS transporter [Actinomycetota bacterium]